MSIGGETIQIVLFKLQWRRLVIETEQLFVIIVAPISNY